MMLAWLSGLTVQPEKAMTVQSDGACRGDTAGLYRKSRFGTSEEGLGSRSGGSAWVFATLQMALSAIVRRATKSDSLVRPPPLGRVLHRHLNQAIRRHEGLPSSRAAGPPDHQPMRTRWVSFLTSQADPLS